MHSEGGFDVNSGKWIKKKLNLRKNYSPVNYMGEEQSHINISSNYDKDGK